MHSVRLGPLTAEETSHRWAFPHLHASTGGHPRFVTEAIAGNGTRPELSPTLSEALLAQCRAAGRPCLPRAGRGFPARAAVRAGAAGAPCTGVDVIEFVEELERLCERRILRIDGFRFRFRYDLVREVLLASLSPARLRLLQAESRSTPAALTRQGSRAAAHAWIAGDSTERIRLFDRALRTVGRTGIRHRPGSRSHPRRQRRRLRDARLRPRGAAQDTRLADPSGRARADERLPRTGPERRPSVHDQAHVPDEDRHVPADGDVAARVRERRSPFGSSGSSRTAASIVSAHPPTDRRSRSAAAQVALSGVPYRRRLVI